MTVEPLMLNVELVGIQRNDDGDIQAVAPMWSGPIYPAKFGEVDEMIMMVLDEHKAEPPISLIKPEQVTS